jgi:hypothetical protein
MRSQRRRTFIKDVTRVLADPKNRRIILAVFISNLLLFIAGRIYIGRYLERKPCVICGRPNTKAVNTLWQYEVKVVPYCKDVQLWYCKRHIRKAPEIVKEIPSDKDTIAKRYYQALIAGTLQMITLLYALILMNFDIRYFWVSPLIIAFAFGIGGVTASLSLTILFVSIVIVPGFVFYLWTKLGNSK